MPAVRPTHTLVYTHADILAHFSLLITQSPFVFVLGMCNLSPLLGGFLRPSPSFYRYNCLKYSVCLSVSLCVCMSVFILAWKHVHSDIWLDMLLTVVKLNWGKSGQFSQLGYKSLPKIQRTQFGNALPFLISLGCSLSFPFPNLHHSRL